MEVIYKKKINIPKHRGSNRVWIPIMPPFWYSSAVPTGIDYSKECHSKTL